MRNNSSNELRQELALSLDFLVLSTCTADSQNAMSGNVQRCLFAQLELGYRTSRQVVNLDFSTDKLTHTGELNRLLHRRASLPNTNHSDD